LMIRRKARPVPALILIVLVIGIISCGGGSTATVSGGGGGGTGGGGGGNGGGGGTPHTVIATVQAQAANTQSDMNNLKTVGPIVITLK
jgi:hypothetical protein